MFKEKKDFKLFLKTNLKKPKQRKQQQQQQQLERSWKKT
jgi:hypothetical protein